MIAVALVIITPMAANRHIVVGGATTCPTICSRWLRPKRVKSGMLIDSVAQKPIIAVSDGTNTLKNDGKAVKRPGSASSGANPRARQAAHQRRAVVVTSTNGDA